MQQELPLRLQLATNRLPHALAADVGSDRPGAQDQRGKTPSRQKDPGDQDQQNDHRRYRGKCERRVAWHDFGGNLQWRNFSSSNPANSTTVGTQK